MAEWVRLERGSGEDSGYAHLLAQDVSDRASVYAESSDAAFAMAQATAPSVETTTACWRTLFQYLKQSNRMHLLTGIALACGTSMVSPTMSIFLGKVFDSFQQFSQPNGDRTVLRHQVAANCGYIAILGGVSFFLSFAFYACWISFGERQAADACHRLFANLMNNEISWFETQPVGIEAIAPHYQMQVAQLKDGISQPLGYVFEYLFTGIGALAVSFAYSWRLTLVILSTVPVLGVVISFISRKIQGHILDHQTQLALAAKHLANSLRFIGTVKCLNSQVREIDTYDALISKAAARFFKQAKADALQAGITRCFILLMFVQGFYYGWKVVHQTDISAGNVITAFWSSLTFTQAIEQIVPQLLAVQKACFAASALSKISNSKSFSTESPPIESAIEGYGQYIGHIQFENVNFTYPAQPDSVVLKGLHCSFPAGETRFIIGKSGSGKSTIPQLLLKFYHPSTGRILLSNKDISTADSKWLRGRIALVGQQTVLFRGSLFDNIALGSTQERGDLAQEVEDAAEFALLRQTIIDLEEGFDTLISGKKSALSVGQQQRLAIARAKIRDPEVLVLDECTNALDRINRDLMRSAIRVWRNQKTTIVITHDLSQVGQDDFLYLLENGTVVAGGTRKSLERDCNQHFRHFASDQKSHSHKQNHAGSSTGKPLVVPEEPESITQTAKRSKKPGQAMMLIGEDAIQRRRRVKQKLRLQVCHGQQPLDLENASIHNQDRDDENIALTRILATVWPLLPMKARTTLGLGLSCATLHGLATPVFSWIFSKLLVTLVQQNTSSDKAFEYAITIVGIAVGDGLFTYMMHTFLQYSGQCWANRLRLQAFSRLMYQDMAFYANIRNAAVNIVHCLDRHAEETRNLLGRTLALVLVAVLMMIICISWSLIVCWELTLIALAMGPIFWLITFSYQNTTTKIEKRINDAFEIVTAATYETFTCLKTVRAYTLEKHFSCLHLSAVQNTLRIGYKKAVLCGMIYGLSECFIIFVSALIFLQGAKLASSTEYNVPDILFVFSMLLFSMSHAAATLALVPQISSSKDTAARLMRLSELPSASEEDEGDIFLSSVQRIDLKNVSFSYPGYRTQRVLKGVNLHLGHGSITAVVGSSGSGKSTLAYLLLRLYSVSKTNLNSGITVNQHRIETLNTSRLRSTVALVPQEPAIFPNTIAENIAYGLAEDNPMRSKQLIQQVAQIVGLDEFVMGLSETYDTMIGDGYMECSGGQSQRLMMARALIKAPSVLILDEVTSALDAHNGELVRDSIRKLKGRHPDMIVMIITHDREMMHLADEIVVLEDGCVVESGSYDQLLAEGNYFARLIRKGKCQSS